jgi:hypothetical protein
MTAGIARPALTVFAIAAAARLAAWWVFPLPEPNYYYWLARGLLDLDAFALGPDPTSFIEPMYLVPRARLDRRRDGADATPWPAPCVAAGRNRGGARDPCDLRLGFAIGIWSLGFALGIWKLGVVGAWDLELGI